MTVITYRAGVMAADSRITAGGITSGRAYKIREINGYLVGAAGLWGVACEVFDWFEAECKGTLKRPPAALHVDDDKYPVSLLIVRKRDRAVFLIDGLGYPQRMYGSFFAIGSGAQLAMGAFEMGADAVAAAKVACKHNGSCGGPIRTLSVDK